MWDGTNWHGTPSDIFSADTVAAKVGDREQVETMPVARHSRRPCNACKHIETNKRSVMCAWLHCEIIDTYKPPCSYEQFTESWRWVPTMKRKQEEIERLEEACADAADTAVRRHGGSMMETGDCISLAETVTKAVRRAASEKAKEGRR